MPKGNKKLSGANQKKAKAGQSSVKKSDFAKVRHKVGRKLPPPPNATVTTVKAKRLVLAGQSVGVDRSQRAVSSRGLALEELLPQLSHYSQRVRLDATTGLQELLTTHPWCVHGRRVCFPVPPQSDSRCRLLSLHVGRVVTCIAPLVSDADSDVRGAVRGLLGEVLLPQLPPQALSPFSPLLVLHVCGAMTHLDERVRRDALGVLTLLVGAAPEAVCGSALHLLGHFADLLRPAAQGGGVTWHANRLTAVMGPLTTFLAAWQQQLQTQAGMSDAGDEGTATTAWTWHQGATCKQPLHAHRGWGMAPPGPTSAATLSPGAAHRAGVAALAALAQLWPRLVAVTAHTAPALGDPAGCDDATLACLRSTLAATAAAQGATHAALALLPSPTTPGGEAVLGAADTVKVEAAREGIADAWSDLVPLLRRIFPSPASCAASARPTVGHVRGEAALSVGHLNLAVTALVLDHGSTPGDRDQAAALEAAAVEFLDMALRGRCTIDDPLGTVPAVATPPEAHAPLLRLTQRVLLARNSAQGAAPAVRLRLLGTVTHVWAQAPTQGADKAACLTIMRSLLQAACSRPEDSHAVPPDIAAAWLAALPRLLFELRHKAPPTSLSVLQLLRHAAVARCHSQPLALAVRRALCELEPQLAPFFALPSAAPGAAPRQGPFLRLPRPVQHAALAALCCLPRLSAGTLHALALCCSSPAADEELVSRSAEAVAFASGLDAASRTSWLTSLLMGAQVGVLQQAAAKATTDDEPAAQTGAAATMWQLRSSHMREACTCLAALACDMPGGAPWPLALLLAWPLSSPAAGLSRYEATAILELLGRACGVATDDDTLLGRAPELLAHAVLMAAKQGAVSVPPLVVRTFEDAHDPGCTPAVRLLALRPALVGPVMRELARLAEDDGTHLLQCMVAAACILDSQEAAAGLVAAASQVSDAVARIQRLAAAAPTANRLEALSVHLGLSMRRVG